MPKSSKTDMQKVRDLFSHCMVQRWFEAAHLTAVIYSDYHPSSGQCCELASTNAHKNSLHKHVIVESAVPTLICVKSLLSYSRILKNNGQVQLAEESIGKAKTIFCEQGHAFGALLIEMDQLQSPLPRMSALQRITRIQEIKTSLEAIGNWHDAISAAQYMYRIALIELSDRRLLDTLYEETLKVPGFSQGSVRYIFW